jgi:DNA polymerase
MSTDVLTPSLHLDERQRAMLHAMGVTHWWPEPKSAPAVATVATEKAPVAATMRPTSAPMPPRTSPAENKKTRADNPYPSNDTDQFDLKNKSNTPPPLSPAVPHTPVHGVSEMDWDALEDTIAQCQACGLCQGRTRTVSGMGPRQARWMVVGEAPGEQEDKQGQPFVGPAGQLLDAMLAAMGLAREHDVFIANVIKCRPPHNRNPDASEVAQCLPYLRRQIDLVQPDLILAMGKFAAQALLQGVVPDVDKAALGKLRGPVYTVAGIPVVVTYHPAYLLRNPADKAKVWDDLCLAMAHLGHNPLQRS